MSARERTGALVGFGLLASYAALHWFALIADPPLWRCAACVAVALAAAVLLGELRRLPGRRRTVAALVVAVATVAAGFLVVGIPARMLPPGGWDELWAELDAGLAGASQLELPYEGRSTWTRLGILLAAPLALGLAAVVAFWPSASRSPVRRGAGLALLVTLYAVSVTWESPSSELLHGLGLLACIAAYLWLGRLPGSRVVPAVAAVAIAGMVALPAAARIDSTDPLIKYGNWKLFGDERVASFDWDHSYGPLDWPQRGTELFEVEGAERPLYWKTTVLDDFSGAAWARADFAGFETDSRLAGATTRMVANQTRWIEGFEVTMLALRSNLLVTTGTTLSADDVGVLPASADGTTPVLTGELDRGSSYRVTAYTPNPSGRLLRRRDGLRYPLQLQRYTSLTLPGTDPTGLPPDAEPVSPLANVTVPLRTEGGSESAPITVGGSLPESGPYARVAALARRITSDTAGNYQAVAEIERYLLENYEYEQDVPDHNPPLPAFLFEDRRGYCQHFSGAMALMLRMIGIPSRVVSGFAPGLPDPDTGTYIVRDTDAHSWVEVWFPTVGWVTVDPTPSAAPARTETTQLADVPGAPPAFGLGRASAIEEAAQSGPLRGGELGESGGDDGGGAAGLLWLALVVIAGGLVYGYRRRRRRLLSPEGAEPQLRELERVVPLVRPAAAPGITLLGIEREFALTLGPGAARYVEALRRNRFGRGKPRRPGPHERRRLRRALAHGRGPAARLRALRAIPPGGPRL
jgi:protein-glutamine gamma-glutamyltransferase